jgi:hypothetical protein
MILENINTNLSQESIAKLLETISRLSEENTQLKQNLEATEKKLEWFIEQIKLNKNRQFAAKN